MNDKRIALLALIIVALSALGCGMVQRVVSDLPPPRRAPEANERNPLVGTWHEVGRLSCESGEEFTPENLLEEILLYADGEVVVTQYAFESYYGYKGEFAFSEDEGTFSLFNLDEINDPPPLPTTGTYAFDDAGRLVLTDVQFITTDPDAGCGHVLEHR